ncbi:hypothetical protein ABT297_33815 [Dactylosporangium sp. NPDC000555]|uniref:hypothetical protein n=1 Tax=Dactylosporangium sp. NPDC000555 TaxID=3154260 RepID=UPI003332E105
MIVVAVIAAGCIGFGVHLTQATGDPVCGGRTMNSGEKCVTIVNGSEGKPKTAEEQADSQASATHVFGWIFIGGGVLVVLSGLMFARTARRIVQEDRAKAEGGAGA